MFNIFNRMREKRQNAGQDQPIKRVLEEQLEENRAVIESLRDYDEGKKDISTVDVERHLRGVRAAS